MRASENVKLHDIHVQLQRTDSKPLSLPGTDTQKAHPPGLRRNTNARALPLSNDSRPSEEQATLPEISIAPGWQPVVPTDVQHEKIERAEEKAVHPEFYRITH